MKVKNQLDIIRVIFTSILFIKLDPKNNFDLIYILLIYLIAVFAPYFAMLEEAKK